MTLFKQLKELKAIDWQYKELAKTVITLSILMLALWIAIMLSAVLRGQPRTSPATWPFPQGNAQATHYVSHRTEVFQALDSLKIKWQTNELRGDIIPLIGDIVPNEAIIPNNPYFKYAPLELVALMGDTLIILNGNGKVIDKFSVSQPYDEHTTYNDIVSVSALLDTALSASAPLASGKPLIVGFEGIEAQATDSQAVTYIGGWNNDLDKFQYIRRLAINLQYDNFKIKDYTPNYSASIKPIFAKRYYLPDFALEDGLEISDSMGYIIYATVDMDRPLADSTKARPYLRGMTAFRLRPNAMAWPVPDIGDRYEYRIHLGPQVGFAQPSIKPIQSDSSVYFLLPCQPAAIGTNKAVTNETFPAIETTPNASYMFQFRSNKDGTLTDEQTTNCFPLTDEVQNTNPRSRSYYLDVRDANVDSPVPSPLILVASEYNGTAGKSGRAALHLFDAEGTMLYDYYDTDEEQVMLPFMGGDNHYWSIGIGNLDGIATNHGQGEYEQFYPNIPGKEIIATQSSRDFAYPNNRLMVFRYSSSPYLTPKASPPETNLRNFDTICTFPIQGWLAAVNDLDGAADMKDEVVLVCGSAICVLRMNDYHTQAFYSGRYFDTVFYQRFGNESVTAAAVADVDGDGRNDIIVTTNASTYVIGTPLEKTLTIISNKPQSTTNQSDYCFGDTVHLAWQNIIAGATSVEIAFWELGKPFDSAQVLASGILNLGDTARYNILIDSLFAGRSGRLVLKGDNSIRNWDTTQVLSFAWPRLEVTTRPLDTLQSGGSVSLGGTVTCADSVVFYYSFDSLTWLAAGSATLTPIVDGGFASYDFMLEAAVPCLPLFDCSSQGIDTTILGVLEYYRGAAVSRSEVFALTLVPAAFSVAVEPCSTICPSRRITWAVETDMEGNPLRDGELSVYESLDSGVSYRLLGVVPLSLRAFDWSVPSFGEMAVLRFCADSLCLWADTVIRNYVPKYVKAVAPNPLKIPEILEVVSVMPEDGEVTIRVVDQSNRAVATLVEGVSRLGGYTYCDRWDGRLGDLTPASNGMYYVMLEFSNGLVEVYPLYIRN